VTGILYSNPSFLIVEGCPRCFRPSPLHQFRLYVIEVSEPNYASARVEHLEKSIFILVGMFISHSVSDTNPPLYMHSVFTIMIAINKAKKIRLDSLSRLRHKSGMNNAKPGPQM